MRPNRLIDGFFVFIGAPGFEELSLQPDRFSDCKIGSDLSQNSLDLVHGDMTGIRKGLIENLQPFGAHFAVAARAEEIGSARCYDAS
jgi:hypothetical protein